MPVVVRHRNAVFSAGDKAVLFYQFWAPKGGTAPPEPRRPIVVVHGMGEHGGRYRNLVDRFAPQGWPIFIPDLRGHGWSEGPRCHVAHWDRYLDDLHRLIRIVERTHPGPVFLVGHSMGGLIALRYAQERPADVHGLVLMSSLLRIEMPVPAWKAALGTAFSWVWPTFSMPTGLNPKFLSHDPAVVAAYRSDPKVHDRATARWFTEMQEAMREAWAKAAQVSLPTLLLCGTDDRLTAPEGSEALVRALASADRTLQTYQGFYHELHNETDHARVLGDLHAWIQGHAGSAQQGAASAA